MTDRTDAVEALVRHVAGDQYKAVKTWVRRLMFGPITGPTILLMGPSRTGKSTFTSLMVRVASAVPCIAVDGPVDLDHCDKLHRNSVAMVVVATNILPRRIPAGVVVCLQHEILPRDVADAIWGLIHPRATVADWLDR